MFRYEIGYTLRGLKPWTRIVTREGLLEAMRAGPYGIKATKANRYMQIFESEAVIGDPTVYETNLPHGKREMRVWRIN